MKKNCIQCNIEFDSDSDVCDDCNAYAKFIKLVEDQFTYGGQKYALNGNNTRESTDVLFDKHGKNWLIGTIDKYCFRFRNLSRERDLLKIACYMYIMWLKRGFYVRTDGINDPPLDTNITQKIEYFNKFVVRAKNTHVEIRDSMTTKRIEELRQQYQLLDNTFFNIDHISEKLGLMSKENWVKIEESTLLLIFNYSFLTWVERYVNVEKHDTDTGVIK